MRENKFRRWIKKEIETEAEALEQQVEANEELSSVRMPDDSYADLMKRIEAREKSSAAPAPKAFHIRRRTLLAVALVAILLAAVGVGASGERLFSPTVESRTETQRVLDLFFGRIPVPEDYAYTTGHYKKGVQ